MTFDTVMTETLNAFAMSFSVTVDTFDLPGSQLSERKESQLSLNGVETAGFEEQITTA
jgi:hypothetical protein